MVFVDNAQTGIRPASRRQVKRIDRARLRFDA
jgi:hypothetical protein